MAMLLRGMHVKVLTDHNPLTHFHTQKTLSRRQARWAEVLSNYSFDIEYKPGELNPADVLSRPQLCVLSATRTRKYRLPHPQLEAGWSRGSDTKTVTQQFTADELRRAYDDDAWFKKPAHTKSLIKKGRLWYFKDRLVLPNDQKIKDIVLFSAHDREFAVHPSNIGGPV